MYGIRNSEQRTHYPRKQLRLHQAQPIRDLISETPLEPFTTDTYFEQYDQPTFFAVKGQEIVVASKRLADALLKLTEQRRNVLFLYFFFGYTDAQIGKEYGRNRSTANYWKLAALKQLRKEMERLEHEEQEADTL
mgnify:CR=1 FL=1